MTYTAVLAQAPVSDLHAAETWYTALLGRGPDARPMGGLLEWHVTSSAGVQLWTDPARAGRSTLLVAADDLDADAARLTAGGVVHDGPQPGGGGRLLQLTDPDGNCVVVSGR